ncbi:MAG: DEAD/DEAH box helicase [Hyphomicrobiales bacterium]|nr:DEAD/DEAH box helicase [Hyphomicrobiales bacterium]
MKILQQIPSMSAIEREQLRINCERLIAEGGLKQQAEARMLLGVLDRIGVDGDQGRGFAPPARSAWSKSGSSGGLTRKSPLGAARGFGRKSGDAEKPASKIMPRRTAPEPVFVKDAEYEALPGVSDALAAIDQGAKAVLILGRAGTGKTTLIRYLRQRPGGETQAIVAPTGVAALNAGAQTIHSFFHLIIDEISMVRVDVMDAIDARLRQIRNDQRPFGGVQIVMVGDFMQLPPVVPEVDRAILEQMGYPTPYAFSARALGGAEVHKIVLDTVYRQDEQEFIDLLGMVRSGDDVERAVELLNARCYGPHRAGVAPLLLTATLAAADRYNREGLAALEGEPSVFEAALKGKFEAGRDKPPIPDRLELKVGARVMATRNDTQKRWINGSLGTVTRLVNSDITVRFDHSREECLIEPVKWEKIRQVWSDESQKIENEVIGAFEQVPLIPAWAITIHKAQGLTLNDVRVDFGTGAFAPGQVYVALSRVRSMAGLSLARPLRLSDFRTDPMLNAFMDWM